MGCDITRWNAKKYFKYIKEFVKEERLSKTIYPPAKDLFNAFKLTNFKDIKVVILGQDPYHGEKEAMGLSFSVRRELGHHLLLEIFSKN